MNEHPQVISKEIEGEGRAADWKATPPTAADLPSLAGFFQDPPADKPREYRDWLRKNASDILQQDAGEPECLLKFAKKWLNEELLFGPSARILAAAERKYGDRQDAFSNKLKQQLALATYKDEETPTRGRLNAALDKLAEIAAPEQPPLSWSDAQHADAVETWALRGAVYRRLADLDGNTKFLHKALDCYRRAHAFDQARGADFDGYGALNAAYLLDSLAAYFEAIGDGPIIQSSAQAARSESKALREEIVAKLTPKSSADAQEWLHETLAGAYFGLGLAELRNGGAGAGTLLDEAGASTEKAFASHKADWKRETTYAQWLRVAHFNAPRTGDTNGYWEAAAKVINVCRDKCGAPSLTGPELAGDARRGKVGLALSGGGFRASFYHIGVLARLAEADVLRHVDVLSTVSGGSIVGAHYYLLLRDLLEREENPTKQDYIELVEKLRQDFFKGSEQNLRMRGLSNPKTAWDLLFKRNYTRSDRMAELYDEAFYLPAVGGAEASERIQLKNLRVTPAGENDTFNPRFANWRRKARVPALLINATSLNTGHSWHFTANWMGEPPELIGDKVDKNERLRRVPYDKAPGEKNQNLSLGFAVAASACVPGIFEPLRLPELFPDRLVRLVDGGVHDNQGVDALVGHGCDYIFCSDASGQTGDIADPPNGPVGTPKRSMDILMKRVRDAEYGDVENRAVATGQRGLFFVHLKAELPVQEIDWVGCDEPTAPQKPQTPTYGIDNKIQDALSEIRTDLDSFSEVEACALMNSGYQMACAELDRLDREYGSNAPGARWGGFQGDAPKSNWYFLQLEDVMKPAGTGPLPQEQQAARDDLALQLDAGSGLFFKLWRLTGQRLVGAAGAVILIIVALLYLFSNWEAVCRWLTTPLLSNGVTLFIVVATGLVMAVPGLRAVRVWCFESFFAAAGFLLSNMFFRLDLNQKFLERGRLARLLGTKAIEG